MFEEIAVLFAQGLLFSQKKSPGSLKKKKKDKYSRVEPSASQMLIDFVFFWLINPSLFDKKFVTSSDETRNKLQGRYF